MATIDSKFVIDRLIHHNGFYPNTIGDDTQPDSRVHMIVEYTNAWGKTTWGVTWETEAEPYKRRYLDETDRVINPRVIWLASDHPVTH